MLSQDDYAREIELRRKYLSLKPPLLFAPGTSLAGSYYTNNSSTIELVEVEWTQGRIQTSPNSLLFGSNAQIVLPIGSLLAGTYLHLELPLTNANQTIIRNWGHAMIGNLNYLWGAQSSPNQQISGDSVFHMNLGQSVNAESASEMVHLAGEQYVGVPPAGVTVLTADILLPLPFSTLNTLFSKKGFDTSLLLNPITILITFNNANAIYAGTGPFPTQFSSAVVTCNSGAFSNTEQSLRNDLIRNPEMSQPYPFLFPQSYVTPIFAGSTNRNNPCILQFQNLSNSDLLGMMFSVVKVTDKSPADNSTQAPNPFNYDDITNITLQLNGQTYYYSPGRQYKLINMKGKLGASYFWNSVFTSATASYPKNTYPVYVDFSGLRALLFQDDLQNTQRVFGNSFSCTFNTTEDTTPYICNVTYIYNGVNNVKQQQSTIYT